MLSTPIELEAALQSFSKGFGSNGVFEGIGLEALGFGGCCPPSNEGVDTAWRTCRAEDVSSC